MIHTGGPNFWSCGYKYSSPNYMGVVSQSVDGGLTWTRHELYSGTSYGYIRAIAADPNDGSRVYAIGYENSGYVLHKTADNGATWTQTVPTGFTGTPYDMMFHPTDPDRLVIGASGGLYESTDGGSSWSRVTTAFSTVNGLYQSGMMNALIICTSTGIWEWPGWTGSPAYWGDDPGTGSVKCAIDFNGDFLMAGSTGAAVWTCYLGTGVSGEEYEQVDSPFNLTVSPNPVIAGEAQIMFTVPPADETQVLVYNIAGRLERTLFHGSLDPGSHSMQLSAGEIPSGVYFAVVRSDTLTETARFVVSK